MKTEHSNFSNTNQDVRPLEDAEYDYLKTSSACDCTGLIPSAPIDENEIENYEELYPFLPPTDSAGSHKL